MSLHLGVSRSDQATTGTAAATVTALLGFPLVFYGCALFVLCLSALGVALLGVTGSGSPPDGAQSSGIAMAIGIAVANFGVALIVISAVFRLFAEARRRPTIIAFAIGYTAFAGMLTFATEIELVWSVIGVASACLLRYVKSGPD